MVATCCEILKPVAAAVLVFLFAASNMPAENCKCLLNSCFADPNLTYAKNLVQTMGLGAWSDCAVPDHDLVAKRLLQQMTSAHCETMRIYGNLQA